MAFKTEVQSRNGTLSINQQTTSQRTKFGQRFRGSLGVASDNLLGTNGIFSDSPIGEFGAGDADDDKAIVHRLERPVADGDGPRCRGENGRRELDAPTTDALCIQSRRPDARLSAVSVVPDGVSRTRRGVSFVLAARSRNKKTKHSHPP